MIAPVTRCDAEGTPRSRAARWHPTIDASSRSHPRSTTKCSVSHAGAQAADTVTAKVWLKPPRGGGWKRGLCYALLAVATLSTTDGHAASSYRVQNYRIGEAANPGPSCSSTALHGQNASTTIGDSTIDTADDTYTCRNDLSWLDGPDGPADGDEGYMDAQPQEHSDDVAFSEPPQDEEEDVAATPLGSLQQFPPPRRKSTVPARTTSDARSTTDGGRAFTSAPFRVPRGTTATGQRSQHCDSTTSSPELIP